MKKIKVHELAKELNIASNDILDVAKKLKMDLKSHLSNMSEDEAKKIKDSLVNGAKNNKKVNMKNDSKKEEKPFVVRRAVIMEEDHTEKKEVKEEKYGKIAKKNKGDYNIVYKKEEEKPMSISQLFGLVNDKSKGTAKEEKESKRETKKKEDIKETKKVEKGFRREDKNKFEKPFNKDNKNFKPKNRVKVEAPEELPVEDDKAFRNYEKEKKGRQKDRKRDEGKELASPRRASRREDDEEYDLDALNYFKTISN